VLLLVQVATNVSKKITTQEKNTLKKAQVLELPREKAKREEGMKS
jgi:hypothetical protein